MSDPATIEHFVNRVICGDSVETMKTIPSASIDCVVTDPPYGLSNGASLAGFKGGKPVEKNWKWDRFDDPAYDLFTNSYMAEISRVLKPGRLAYVWCGDLYAGVLARIGKTHGMKPKCIVVAKKLNASPSWRKNNWRIVFETCLVLSKGPLRLKEFHFLGHHEMANYMDGTGEPTGRDVFITECVFPVGDKVTRHDCEKPVAVIRPLIEASTNPGDIVLDCFSGSGTTLVVAKLVGRQYIGIEREQRWVDSSMARLAQEVLFTAEVLMGTYNPQSELYFDDSDTDESDLETDAETATPDEQRRACPFGDDTDWRGNVKSDQSLAEGNDVSGDPSGRPRDSLGSRPILRGELTPDPAGGSQPGIVRSSEEAVGGPARARSKSPW